MTHVHDGSIENHLRINASSWSPQRSHANSFSTPPQQLGSFVAALTPHLLQSTYTFVTIGKGAISERKKFADAQPTALWKLQ